MVGVASVKISKANNDDSTMKLFIGACKFHLQIENYFQQEHSGASSSIRIYRYKIWVAAIHNQKNYSYGRDENNIKIVFSRKSFVCIALRLLQLLVFASPYARFYIFYVLYVIFNV